jgi:type II secretory pathway pseudopilin PulG
MRFTLRRLMMVIGAAAILLAVYLQVVERQRRQALMQQLNVVLHVNRSAQQQARAMADSNYDGQISPEEAQRSEETLARLQQEEQELREKLARLRH